ncbi:hypothetical protein [Nakamurella deserti]|uniref:hypothetical protein n=1 Tax=Nakamurella deserti TaxID=2164074 RepID=UPI000DBE9F05|nr:hypothetical protein [Nakamurella deserti]
MTTPWNTAGTTTTVGDGRPETAAPQQAWQQAPAPQPAWPQAPQYRPEAFGPAAGAPAFGVPPFGPADGPSAPTADRSHGFPPPSYGAPAFGPGGMPPQGPGGPGFTGGPGFPGGAAPRKNTTLIISLIVAAVLLIGGGVTAFVLLGRDDPAGPTGPGTAAPTAGPTVGAPTATTTSRPQDDPTPTTSTSDSPATGPATTGAPPATTGQDDPIEDDPIEDDPIEDDPVENTDLGGGDMATAEGLIENWLGFVNEGDAETASQLICAAEQQDFIDGFAGVTTPANQLEAVDMQWDGDTIALTLGAVGDTTGESRLDLTMWPTDTGWFLICSNPLSAQDLNW